MRAVEAHIEVPSKPARLGLWLRFRRAMFVLRRVLPAVPGALKSGWRNARTAWRLGRELAGIAKQIQAEQDANIPFGFSPLSPVGPLSCPLAGDSGSIALSICDFTQDAGFMLERAGDAVKGFERFGRGALTVNFGGDPLRPQSEVYFPLELIENMGVGEVILGPVKKYDPVSEAVVVLSDGEIVKACLVGVERIVRGGAGRIERRATDGPGPNGPF